MILKLIQCHRCEFTLVDERFQVIVSEVHIFISSFNSLIFILLDHCFERIFFINVMSQFTMIHMGSIIFTNFSLVFWENTERQSTCNHNI